MNTQLTSTPATDQLVAPEPAPPRAGIGVAGPGERAVPRPRGRHGGVQGLAPAVLDVVVPVYNEERSLVANVRRLRLGLDAGFPFPSVVTIADNASTDGTWAAAQRLAAAVPGVRVLHLDQKGRGRALRAAWTASEAEAAQGPGGAGAEAGRHFSNL